jgi:phage terminase large subunit-like protein
VPAPDTLYFRALAAFLVLRNAENVTRMELAARLGMKKHMVSKGLKLYRRIRDWCSAHRKNVPPSLLAQAKRALRAAHVDPAVPVLSASQQADREAVAAARAEHKRREFMEMFKPPPRTSRDELRATLGTADQDAAPTFAADDLSGAVLARMGVSRDLTFPQFAKTMSFPPYYGLYAWQIDCYEQIWPHDVSVTCVPRDHGKSVLFCALEQWAMLFKNYDVLHLGWTARRKEVAENVYNFHEHWDLVESTPSTSQYHFRTTYGGRFDCFLITSKETLGLHAKGAQTRGSDLTDEDLEPFTEETAARLRAYYKAVSTTRRLLVVVDDPIDDTFLKLRHKEQALERRFTSTILNVGPDKWIFVGTRKFAGDFFTFLDSVFQDKMFKYIRTPYVTDPADPLYALDPADHLLCPERWTVEKLAQKRKQNGEYWWSAEFMQDPHPVTNEVFPAPQFIHASEDFTRYDYVGLAIDRATTTNATSDDTGVIKWARRAGDGEVHVLDDLTAQHSFEALQELVSAQYRALRQYYPRSTVLIIVEKQGGGDDFYSSARARGEHWTSHAVLVHSTRGKTERVTDWLEGPLTSGTLKILHAARHSPLVQQINQWPHPQHDDAIDACATLLHVLEDYPVRKLEKIQALRQTLQNRRYQAAFDAQGLPRGVADPGGGPGTRKRPPRTVFP